MKHHQLAISIVASVMAFPLLAMEPVHFTQAEIDATEAQLTDFPLMRAVKSSIATRDNSVVEAVSVANPNNPDNVRRLESVLSEAQFEFLFPVRAPEYTYLGLLQSAAKFPALCGEYADGRDSLGICRKSLATMFAHFAQETGAHDKWMTEPQWRQGLYWVREVGWDETKRGGYNMECNPDTWQGQEWPCGTFSDGSYKSYFGRGAKQLSYNYNYGPFSDAMFGDVHTLLNNPEQVADTWLNLASAVFFFTYPQPPKASMLHVIDGTWQPNARDGENGLKAGFGITTHIINGGIECGSGSEKPQSVNRIEYYQALAQYMGVPIEANEELGCKDMKPFDTQGAGAMQIYWEQDWSYIPDNPNGGKSYACKLVGYQTRYSAFKDGDYVRCLQYFFPEIVIDDSGTPTDPTVPVNQPPKAQIQGPSEGDAGSVISLSAAQSNDPEGGALSYLWKLPVGGTATAINQVNLDLSLPTPSNSESVFVMLTVTDEAGATSVKTHSVLVKLAGETPPDGASPYQVGHAYAAGDIVSNASGLYECKPFPYTAWCAGAAWAYEPGVGAAWQDAWIAR
ncbi:glycoside hydrolase family 19 protein [Shewanella violacea]|uniref:Chitinase, putative n=1 Tax=Shewanella violacea (strain JCM 10179 / CIP 106290 / LMG 19151 / DSS12) TaxID=637905 RepID=D4ZGM9_SHEVD|nr:glycoside hydrolase family 19 protein [Shewanella violacea]BAJ00828.1 chitinase, putative [Shewanella violacea DSS12]